MQLPVVPFAGQLRHKFGEELGLICKLYFYLLEFLPSCVTWQNWCLVLLNKSTKLLDGHQDLDDKLCNFGLFAAKHWLVEDFI